MKTSDFSYDLPEELIAQDPAKRRDLSRLLVINKNTGKREHKVFHDIIDYLVPGDCLVVNDTKVIPARLVGEREGTGGKVEVLLLKRKGDDIWETLVRPGKKARPGQMLEFGGGLLKAEVLEVAEDGNRLVQFSYNGIFEEILDGLGQMPLPPYITHKLEDKNRYQTVYAKYEGSAAAPTAGLHFTEELLKEIEEKGVNIAKVTLHVGLGTFRPVKSDNIENHHMHTEEYYVGSQAADLINSTRKKGGRVICVGTTSLRTVESAAAGYGIINPGGGDTDIFIYPGYQFKIADALITNFHLPESTLLMLVSALEGQNEILAAYKEAVSLGYRFFSFGDAMFMETRKLVYNADGTY
ncbi:MAG: tRNA preQ1(34) S-adenosylmethionine ribosyltransferase-isomerase QueA, partial [Lachnospiraceae bacterium]|nr:tRNA preQ1(34) S-adenosylmethionine ribosyltransferase-isomerase QueA [Lachnospiraceae bacterium]